MHAACSQPRLTRALVHSYYYYARDAIANTWLPARPDGGARAARAPSAIAPSAIGPGAAVTGSRALGRPAGAGMRE